MNFHKWIKKKNKSAYKIPLQDMKIPMCISQNLGYILKRRVVLTSKSNEDHISKEAKSKTMIKYFHRTAPLSSQNIPFHFN